jgi:hypothetical protein
MSLYGRILALAARLIGAPLPLDERLRARAAMVAVTADASGEGQIWTRIYGRRAGFPQMVNSLKRFGGPTGLEEHVGGGVSMSLRLEVADGALLFKSVDYYLTLMGRRVRLPQFLSPGAMTIGHHDLGEGRFLFTLTLVHEFLGVLIEQSTVFADMEEAYDRRPRRDPRHASNRLRRDGHAPPS